MMMNQDIEDILDDGIFVLKSIDDMLEVYKSKDIPIFQNLKNEILRLQIYVDLI